MVEKQLGRSANSRIWYKLPIIIGQAVPCLENSSQERLSSLIQGDESSRRENINNQWERIALR